MGHGMRRFCVAPALLWLAAFSGPAQAASFSAIDSFNSISYSGSNGSAAWNGNWTEVGESDGTGAGLVRVVNDATYCVSPNCLRLGGSSVNFSNKGLRRAINLAGASGVTLSFSYKRQAASLVASGGVRVQVSNNGSTWTTLGTIAFTARNDASPLTASYGVPASAATATTQIRLLGTGLVQVGYMHIDNVTVAFTRNAAPTAANDSYSTPPGQTLTVAAPGVLGNDKDPEGTSLTAKLVASPASGSLSFSSNGSFSYIPASSGTFSFTYQASDGVNSSSTATVTVAVAAADKVVDLKLLILATGTPAEDPGLDLIDDLLKQMGVPYTVIDVSRTALTNAALRVDQNHARYNGVILTDAQAVVSHTGGADASGSVGLTLAEWQLLHQFERDFGIRESVISGWPATNAALDLDYGMTAMGSGANFKAQWQPPAGGTEMFEYVKPAGILPVSEWSYPSKPLYPYQGLASPISATPTVEPLLVCAATDTTCPAGYVFVSRLRYNDGRQVLLSTVTNAWWDTESQVLAYEFVKFAAKGVFLGARQAYLSAHVDDLFLPDDLWDMASNTTPGTRTYLATAADIGNLAARQQAFRTGHAATVPADFKLDFAFNGEGVADYGNPLGTYKDQFAYINHSYSHLDMDRTAGTDYALAYSDIVMNASVWSSQVLPGSDATALVTGDHSGIMDDGTTPVTTFPTGANPAFLKAAKDSGVRYLASNSSQVNQNQEIFITGINGTTPLTQANLSQTGDASAANTLLLLPRYPTNVFYNVTNDAELLDEYNWIFYDSYVKAGVNPCTVAGAICTKAPNYAAVMQAEADIALSHILSYQAWPHFFHVSNVKNYSAGKTLVTDWLEAVVNRYEQVMKLPLKNPRYFDVGLRTEKRVNARSATISGQWNLSTNVVTVTASKAASVTVTGLGSAASAQCQGGELYGGECQLSVDLSSTPKILYVNQAVSN
jgi:hypothetical protein